MAAKKNKTTRGDASIAQNRQATHDYFVEERFEAGVVLLGWEVKSLRAGKLQLKESYVALKNGEAWLVGAHISALLSASTHVVADNLRSRKLLLHGHEREAARPPRPHRVAATVSPRRHLHRQHVRR